jgi:four helix bundle protein
MGWKDINDLDIYVLANQVGDLIYQKVSEWDTFNKNTIGYQIVRSADSISANISEGFGRYHFRDQKRFCYIARGSLYETKTWLEKASKRVPKDKKEIQRIIDITNTLNFKLNAFIKYLDNRIT